ncbi:MAG: FIG004556: membrane metalloprotease [uncultured Gemmatimonadetes bacterium]|uniref:FIG004556: membrane metalloprotease n=1 Tax=uncultured Gemmatimonadota bacterium TaxID=203437 RepID=A0A6J4ME38_9BACT|nr:MAG: FIG004556: membrane metalloprotease [uncultured Gemmatimonadota bacterium]
MDRINDLLLYLPVLLLAFTVHEFGHAWVALKQGDDTAYRLGRVTLDPRSHIDPIGSLLFPALATLGGGLPLLGWAKPVPVDVRKLRDYRTGDILVSLAGVFMNLVLVVLFTIAFAVAIRLIPGEPATGSVMDVLVNFLFAGIQVNVGLILFNILPIPPLDGSKVLYHFLPVSAREQYRQLDRYGFLILWGLVLTGALSFLYPLVGGITMFFLGLAGLGR